MDVLIWSNGERYERSRKNEKPQVVETIEINNSSRIEGEYIDRKKSRDNEERRQAILERSMIRRSYQNPFLMDKNYINVINDQEKYLMPLNSNNIK